MTYELKAKQKLHSGSKENISGDVKLSVENGVCVLDSSQQFMVLEIKYTGYYNGSSLLSSKYMLCDNARGTMLIMRVGQENNIPDELFNYSGRFILKSATIYYDKNNHSPITIENNLQLFDEIEDSFNELGTSFDSLANDGYSGTAGGSYGIVSDNLYTSDGTMCFKNKTEYVGDYHYFGSMGHFYTGKTHTSESQRLFMKDKLGRVGLPKTSFGKNGEIYELSKRGYRGFHNRKRRNTNNASLRMLKEQSRKRNLESGFLKDFKRIIINPTNLEGEKKIIYDGHGKPLPRRTVIKTFDEVKEKEATSGGMQRISEKTSDTTPTSGGGGGL